MSRLTKKIIAVVVLLWLPLFTGNALAAAVAMQMPHGSCQVVNAMQEMAHGDMGEHHHADMQMPLSDDENESSCSSCGICHVACAGYIAVLIVEIAMEQVDAPHLTSYSVVYQSISFAPLVPPPSPRV